MPCSATGRERLPAGAWQVAHSGNRSLPVAAPGSSAGQQGRGRAPTRGLLALVASATIVWGAAIRDEPALPADAESVVERLDTSPVTASGSTSAKAKALAGAGPTKSGLGSSIPSAPPERPSSS